MEMMRYWTIGYSANSQQLLLVQYEETVKYFHFIRDVSRRIQVYLSNPAKGTYYLYIGVALKACRLAHSS